MKLLCVGGGSGGHVTPVLAVINELAKLDQSLEITFVTDRAFYPQTIGLVEQSPVPMVVKKITAGKFRRYKDVPLWKQLIRPSIAGRNIVDVFKVGYGTLQSLWLLLRNRPDVVFAKGGYVSLPVGFAAYLLRLPLVIHDSDARPGITNRILARWASVIATGMPLENYSYKAKRVNYTGIPTSSALHVYSKDEQRRAQQSLGFEDTERPLVVVTGGGLGAKEINDATLAIADKLLDQGFNIYHIAGQGPFKQLQDHTLKDKRYQIVPFVFNGLSDVLGAADVVVARGSATILQEIAAAAKPAVVVPNSSLGDQLENAKRYSEGGAVVVLTDEQIVEQPSILFTEIVKITSDPAVGQRLSTNIQNFAKPDAAFRVARLIAEAKGQR